jgi:uncharacterized SAM-binding protein YcdF (DUF218 family)
LLGRQPLLTGAVAVLLGAMLAFRAAGNWLVTADRLQPARAIVVLGGQVPLRAIEAAAVYKQGWAPEVWLTRGAFSDEESAFEELGIERPSEDVYSHRVLERLGVPPAAIRTLPDRNETTADEVRAVAGRLQAEGGVRVIIVTSKSHTRRVKVLWRKLVGNRPEALVRYAAADPFDAPHWWRNSTDAQSVTREWFGMLNAWAGFPVGSTR